MNKDSLLETLLKLPRPISTLAYRGFRKFVKPDPRRPYFDKAFSTISTQSTPGDYLEFGVYRGSSFVTAYYSAKSFAMSDMRFFAFDSFEGLPHGEGHHKEGQHSCDEHLFQSIISKAGVPLSRSVIVKGFYDETLTTATVDEHNISKVAMAYIDCNLYTSTKTALNFIAPFISPGSIIIFDDWHVFGRDNDDFGEAKAFQEWDLKDQFEIFFDTDGPEKAFIMTA